MTKAYVQSLAKALYELKPLGMDILASAPGPSNSGFAARANLTLNRALNPKDMVIATLDASGNKLLFFQGHYQSSLFTP